MLNLLGRAQARGALKREPCSQPHRLTAHTEGGMTSRLNVELPLYTAFTLVYASCRGSNLKVCHSYGAKGFMKSNVKTGK